MIVILKQYYLRARFYNPAIGRFTQEDIYRGDGLNLYAYCKNNPVMYYDPSGYVCDSKKTSLNIFESEPVVIGEEDAGDWIYTYQKDDFKIVLLLSTYEMYIKISICYCENIVYTEMFKQIVEINKLDVNTLKIIKNEKSIIVKKKHRLV